MDAKVAGSARSENENVSQLRNVCERLIFCDAARKEEQEEKALTVYNLEEKSAKVVDQSVVTEDTLCTERSETTARFATLQRASET